MKKTIAVIGIDGNMGPAMAYGFAKAGYRTLVSPYAAEDSTAQTGKVDSLVSKVRVREPRAEIEIVSSAREASWEADIVIPTVPYNMQAAVAAEIEPVVVGKVIISVINPLSGTFDGLLIPTTNSAAEELAQLLPHSKVVKAFNTTLAMDFDTPEFVGHAVDVFIAGDDNEAVYEVAQLVRDVGLTPLSVGGLAMSRTLENMMMLLINLSVRNHFLRPLGWKVVHDNVDQAERRGLDSSKSNS